jgi:hypothetical protein
MVNRRHDFELMKAQVSGVGEWSRQPGRYRRPRARRAPPQPAGALSPNLNMPRETRNYRRGALHISWPSWCCSRLQCLITAMAKIGDEAGRSQRSDTPACCRPSSVERTRWRRPPQGTAIPPLTRLVLTAYYFCLTICVWPRSARCAPDGASIAEYDVLFASRPRHGRPSCCASPWPR